MRLSCPHYWCYTGHTYRRTGRLAQNQSASSTPQLSAAELTSLVSVQAIGFQHHGQLLLLALFYPSLPLRLSAPFLNFQPLGTLTLTTKCLLRLSERRLYPEVAPRSVMPGSASLFCPSSSSQVLWTALLFFCSLCLRCSGSFIDLLW